MGSGKKGMKTLGFYMAVVPRKGMELEGWG